MDKQCVSILSRLALHANTRHANLVSVMDHVHAPAQEMDMEFNGSGSLIELRAAILGGGRETEFLIENLAPRL